MLVSLFIYLFYRTEKTVVNEIFIQLITFTRYSSLKESVNDFLPLNELVIYSLPEGLWIFCITLTSKPFYIQVNQLSIKCVYFPIVYAIGLEIFQMLHFVNGRFDFMDIWISLLFWLLGIYIFKDTTADQNIFNKLNANKLFCICSYSLVYFSHVLK